MTAPRAGPFFLLVFALSVPFAALGFMTGWQFYPGIPASALGFACPAAAAAILSARRGGRAAVLALARRAVDYGRLRSGPWALLILLLMPAIAAGTFGLMRLANLPPAAPQFSPASLTLLLLAFFIAALGEELGWTGYALEPLQARLPALGAALVLGLVWAAWHVVAMVQAGQTPAWIAWGCLDMVATRILMTWLYNHGGRSVFAVALYHAIANLSTKSVFPGGSFAAERIMALLIAGAALLVVMLWRPQPAARSAAP